MAQALKALGHSVKGVTQRQELIAHRNIIHIHRDESVDPSDQVLFVCLSFPVVRKVPALLRRLGFKTHAQAVFKDKFGENGAHARKSDIAVIVIPLLA